MNYDHLVDAIASLTASPREQLVKLIITLIMTVWFRRLSIYQKSGCLDVKSKK